MRRAPLALALLAWTAAGPVRAGAPPAPPPEAKIAPALARELARAAGGPVEMLVVLTDQADLGPARGARGKAEKGRRVHEALTRAAARSQRPLLDELARRGAPARPFWIANFVWTRGDDQLARRLAARADVAAIEANSRLVAPRPIEGEAGPLSLAAPDAPEAIEASLTQVGAPAVWSLGFRGEGVVIAGQDTGVEWTHPALKPRYRGWNGAAADHDYHWHDANHGGSGSCGVDAAAPCDDNNHGTHTMGTMVGDDGGANRIGVAPGARWIACKNMQEGVGSVATYSECFQWFVAPTDLAGANPDPARAPHVVNNSWSCPESEGCDPDQPNVLRAVVASTRAAGIVVVVSAGNSGSSCSTIDTPAAIYDAAFTVGAVDSSDQIADFSSRGPVTVDGSGRMKPDVSAPGVAIRSALPYNANREEPYYGPMWGTSMAGPHVAGVVALLLSADPFLLGEVGTIEAVIRDTAHHPATSSQVCGGVSATQFPNNTFGAGRIDALAAVQSLFAGGLIFRDNLELGGTDRWIVVE